MSSTNRGKKDRHKQDYYVTPIPAIVDFCKAIEVDLGWDWSTKKILDPCAGGDANNPMSYPTALGQVCPGLTVTTIDIRQDSLAQYIGDYTTCSVPEGTPDLVMSNPPFFLAQQFIDKALDDVADMGWVIMLLRLNFFGSGKRRLWWQARMPVWTYVHSERMGFTPDGKTDSIEYCHCMWQKGAKVRATQLLVI